MSAVRPVSPDRREAVRRHVREMVSKLARDGYRRRVEEAVEEAVRLGVPDKEILEAVASAVRRARRRRRSGLV